MSACLSERTLWSVSERGGDAGDALARAHVRECPRCAARLDRLVADVGLIGRVLADEPPPLAQRASHGVRVARLALAAAVLVLALGISVVTRRAPSAIPAGRDDGIAVLGQMSADVFADADDSDDGSGADDVGAALAAATPCEWQVAGCEDVTQPLF